MTKREEIPKQIRQHIRYRVARMKNPNPETQAAKAEAEALAAATQADRTRFILSAEEWTQFVTALEALPKDLPRLRALLQSPGFFNKSLAEKRLTLLSKVMETSVEDLESFLDLLAEEELTDRRIADAQWVLGLCTPICSHLRFPKMEPPACGKELLAEWLRRQANPADQAQAAEEARIRQIRIDHGVFE